MLVSDIDKPVYLKSEKRSPFFAGLIIRATIKPIILHFFHGTPFAETPHAVVGYSVKDKKVCNVFIL